MNTILKIFLYTLLTVSLVANELTWQKFEDALNSAKQDDKTILVSFYTDWCGWCRKMDNETYTNDEVKNLLNKDFVTVKINPEKSGSIDLPNGSISYQQLASELGVRSFPSTAFLTSELLLIDVVPGYYEPSNMKTLLNFMSDGLFKNLSFQDYQLFTEAKKLNETNPSPKLNYVIGYFQLNFFDDKEAAYKNFETALNKNLITKEIYAALHYASSKNSNKSKEWLKKAESLGYTEKSELDDLVIDFVKEIFASR